MKTTTTKLSPFNEFYKGLPNPTFEMGDFVELIKKNEINVNNATYKTINPVFLLATEVVNSIQTARQIHCSRIKIREGTSGSELFLHFIAPPSQNKYLPLGQN